MPWYANPALWTSIAGVIGAIGTVIGLLIHTNGPSHQPKN